MELAVNALTNVWIPEERWSLQFIVDFSRLPSVAYTNHRMDAYLNIPPKFIEALTVCRLASGSKQRMDVDRAVIQSQLNLIGRDGLTYAPSPAETLVGFESASQGAKETESFAEVWAEGRMLLALSMLAQIDDDPRWKEIGKRKVDTLLSMMREADGVSFLWSSRYYPGIEVPEQPDIPDGFDGIYIVGALGHGSALFYRVTGYEPALDLSERLARWALKRVFDDDDGRYDTHHFHHGLYALMAVCEYGVATQDRAVLVRVDACFRWARSLGDPLIGYFPEAMPGSNWYLGRRGNTVEICEVADMVWLALKLTQSGIGEYWDDVDRWVRNMYTEGQLCRADFMDHIPQDYFDLSPHPYSYASTEDIPQRMVGSFFGWMRANEGLDVKHNESGAKLSPLSIMHCCTANGARTLYCVWDSILEQQEDLVTVNLLLNRSSEWLDVDSYLPNEGKVVLKVKSAPQVAVRMPESVDLDQVSTHVNGKPVKSGTTGRYRKVSSLKSGDELVLQFEVPERTVHRVLGEIPYKLTLRGSTVVEIDPPGVAYPLFDAQPTGQLNEMIRFVPKISDLTW